jgi:hypothetical protein
MSLDVCCICTAAHHIAVIHTWTNLWFKMQYKCNVAFLAAFAVTAIGKWLLQWQNLIEQLIQ